MNRLFDLVAVVCLAFVVLLPKASVQARPALDGEPVEMAKTAALEDQLTRDPNDEAVATDLAEVYLHLEHPDWALVVLARFPAQTSSARLSLVRGTAYAERLDAPAAVAATTAGRAICESKGCPPIVAARLQLIEGPMKALVDQKVDPKKDQQRAREIVSKVLHSTHAPTP